VLYVVMQDEFDDRPKKETQGYKTEILAEVRRATQNCKGINFDEPRLLGRYDINLREFDNLQPLDLAWPRLVTEESSEAAVEGTGRDTGPGAS
jgi:hypothetical protein